jgi:hypothetical protein
MNKVLKKAPDLNVVVSDSVPANRWMLVTGKLSLAGKAELAKRVRAGEAEELVLAELLVREKKVVVG